MRLHRTISQKTVILIFVYYINNVIESTVNVLVGHLGSWENLEVMFVAEPYYSCNLEHVQR
jgi:hypothetical protein